MNFLDWCLVALVLAYALSGYWQGFITGAFATTGLVLGGLLGIWLAPMLLGDAAPSLWVSLGALFVVLVVASIGQALLQFGGSRIRDTITWQPVRAVDAIGGAALSVVAVLIVAWMLGVAISGSQIPGIGPQVRESQVLVKVNDLMPARAQQALRSFDDVVGSSFFPRYLEPFARERIVSVAPAQRRVLRDPDVVAAADSVYKIRSANRCGSGVEGSGFVYSPGKLMTNAHVVAGVTEPRVVAGDRTLAATVVYYDPDVDVAVLDVPGLRGQPLQFDLQGRERQQGAVLGYPQDGPFDAQPVRIRADQRLRSPDIYGNGTVTRDVYSMRGLVRPGNSGGPVVGTDGRVLGVVFAASVSDRDTGYALTARQVSRAAATGLEASERVSSGNCA
ncbi:Colicin V production protein [Nocardioides scoriae]|uniref:Colicin V production protein n=1 Tax=Nocardioides scoriae TaxID=642780 RepID=A0A1H1UGP8_9ACTN|nr:MarP family serine protease [Nocardioides scoriae]SDS71049.1 Colicin V production protein [Nocardioides scoriae]